MTKLKRKNIRMSEELASWYEKRAEEIGISQSALMVVALNYYVEYQKALNLGISFDSLLDKLNEIDKEKEEIVEDA